MPSVSKVPVRSFAELGPAIQDHVRQLTITQGNLVDFGLRGQFYENVEFVAGVSRRFEHQLGRAYKGFFIIYKTVAAAELYSAAEGEDRATEALIRCDTSTTLSFVLI